MSEFEANDAGPGAPEAAAPLTEAQLREIVDDPAMTLAEKQALLERYARLDGIDRTNGDTPVLEPLEAQIAEALALLGADGHRTG